MTRTPQAHPSGPSLLSLTAISRLDERQEELVDTPPSGQTHRKKG